MNPIVYCERNRIKFSLEACRKAKEQYPMRCKGCDGPVNCDPVDISLIKAPESKEKKVGVKNVCVKCGEQKTIVSRGLCAKCRNYEIKAGTLDQNYPPKTALFKKKDPAPTVVNEPEKDKVVPIKPASSEKCTAGKDVLVWEAVVRFKQRDADLFNYLSREAEFNRRSLEDEILFRLEHGVL